MRRGDQVQLLAAQGPVTVVPQGHVSAPDRSRALSVQDACWVISRLFMGGDRDSDRHRLCELHRLVACDPGLAYSRADTSRLIEQVLTAVSNGTVVLLDGWLTGDSWTPRRFAGKESLVSVDDNRESKSESRLARRAMGGRQEDVAFEGARYLLLPASRWREVKEQGGYEVVRQEEAAGVLQRMTAKATSSDQKAALGEASKVLADTKKPFVRDGLFLVRRSTHGSVAPMKEAPAAVTPSQVAKQIEWVENVDPVMEGGPVELDFSEAELPVDDDAPVAEASDDSGAAASPEAAETEEAPEAAGHGDDSANSGPQ